MNSKKQLGILVIGLIAVFSLLLTIVLFAKEVNEEMKKRFHL